MRTPRHYTIPRSYVYSWAQYQDADTESVFILDSVGGEGEFFFDTDRGRSQMNDCVHSKILTAFPGCVSLNNVTTARGTGLPQGQYTSQWSSRSLSTADLTVWAHKWVGDGDSKHLVFVRAACRMQCYRTGRLPKPYRASLQRVGADILDWRQDGSNARLVTHAFLYDAGLDGTQLKVGGSRNCILPVGYYIPGPPAVDDFSTVDDARAWVEALAGIYCRRLPDFLTPLADRSGSYAERRPIYDAVSIAPEDFTSVFLFSEDVQIPNNLPDKACGNPRLYWKNWLIQHAYLEACRSVPTLNDNSISNVLEIVGFMKALVVDHKIEFPKRLQDVWLAYRYSYTTTKLDVSEAIKFAKRYMSLGTLDTELKCYGTSATTVNDVDVVCRCSLSITPAQLGYVEALWRSLTTYGLAPSFYVVWDMIPYSFIVDWFIPVGDVLSVLDAESRFSEKNYIIKDVCFSLSYEREIGTYTYKAYSRWRSDPLPHLNGFYWFDKSATSGKVITYRILDAASLFS